LFAGAQAAVPLQAAEGRRRDAWSHHAASLVVTQRPDLDVAATLRLPPETRSAGEARRFIGQFCAATELPEDLCQTAALLVSELVTNAVVHGKTSATVEVHRPVDILRVSVRDDNPVLPAVGDAPPLDAESGRGLTIVAALAHRWGVEKVDSGKAIWFELEVPVSDDACRDPPRRSERHRPL
jgi:anti-sigma regulatory factor (Ser/Thr protein kinase)